MSIEAGTKFQISQNIKGNFNSSEALTVITNNGITVQFTLDDGKGRGSMPVDYLNYLLKKSNLTQVTNNKRLLVNQENNEEKIG
jgi:hypothetical protein